MIKMLGTGLLAAVLAGCAGAPGAVGWRELAGLSAAPGVYRFDWRIAGEPALAPLQVFDDGQRTWLHYPPDQPAPAVFERTPQGDRLLRPQRQGDYLVLSGVPAHIVLRGGLLQAEVWRPQAPVEAAADSEWAAGRPAAQAATGSGPAGPAAVRVAVASTGGPDDGELRRAQRAPAAHGGEPSADRSGRFTASVDTGALSAISSPRPARRPLSSPVPPMLPVVHAVVPAAPAIPAVAAAPLTPAAPAAPAAPIASAAPVASAVPVAVSTAPLPQAMFEATPADGNIRRALNRWARLAGWTFDAEHWAVDVDIPLAGSAVFDGPFLVAVRGLLAATELGDRPVQPCFYANHVLRVVPLAQRCDRTQAAGAAS